MRVVELWRYPVKSMAGERLERARIGPLGIEGDRVVHAQDEDVGDEVTLIRGRGCASAVASNA